MTSVIVLQTDENFQDILLMNACGEEIITGKAVPSPGGRPAGAGCLLCGERRCRETMTSLPGHVPCASYRQRRGGNPVSCGRPESGASRSGAPERDACPSKCEDAFAGLPGRAGQAGWRPRSGRFDSIWFVALPALDECRKIIAIMNRKYGTAMPLEWAEQLNGYTGSELEQIVRDSLFDGLEEARKNLIPLSRTMKEEIDALRSWAMSRARRANTPDEAPLEVRKIRSVARKPLTPAK